MEKIQYKGFGLSENSLKIIVNISYLVTNFVIFCCAFFAYIFSLFFIGISKLCMFIEEKNKKEVKNVKKRLAKFA